MHRFIPSGAKNALKRIILFLILSALTALIIVSVFSCDDTEVEDVDDSDDSDDDDDTASPGGSGDEVICGVTFNEHIKPFLDNYCLRCHSSEVYDSQRNGAPEGSNFDTQQDFLDGAEDIRQRLLDTGGMPPTPPDPSHIERDDVISWIDCAFNELGL